jgi:hypothetical protein
VSPGGGGLGTETPSGVSWGQWFHVFFLSHYITMMFLHPPQEVGESLCVVFEACIHALEGAQVPHDHVGLIEIFFSSK